MRLAEVLTEAIELESSLGNQYKVLAKQVVDPLLRPVIEFLAEESALHATKLTCISHVELEGPADFVMAIDQIAMVKRELAELVTQTAASVQVAGANKLEERLSRLYKRLSGLSAESEALEVSYLLRTIAEAKDHHCSLLRSAGDLLRGDWNSGE